MIHLSRRDLLTMTGTTLGAGALAACATAAADAAPNDLEPFGYALNTSTIRGQKLALDQQFELAARAGYQGIEPWIGDIEVFVAGGGSLVDLAKRARDLGIAVVSAIGFAQWIVDDDAQRAKGLDDARRAMDLVAQLGGTRLAAPPAGAADKPGLDLSLAAERYRALLELGDEMGVVPQLEVWGFSKNLSRLGETLLVAAESRHPSACLLLDVYHLYKGGSGFAALHLVAGAAMHVWHVNDYPASPPRETIGDAQRV
ncbi:MAG TPA: TIM barrel protein, partial [Pirellulales bacterium]|nr:TIM barrel protein [Pirellulales bacterium]